MKHYEDEHLGLYGAILYTMIVLSLFGIWKLVDLAIALWTFL